MWSICGPSPRLGVSVPFERIVCTGPEVWHYRFDKTQIFIYPLDQDAQRRALDEGPLPFLFNMKAQNAQERYLMSLQGENKDVYFVVIKPRLKEDKENFSTAWVFLDRKFLLPVRIILYTPDGQSTRDFKLSNIQANQGVSDKTFQGIKYKGFSVERNPGGPKRARQTECLHAETQLARPQGGRGPRSRSAAVTA